MRRVCCVILLLFVASAARGDDALKPEQLQKMYDDTLAQLKDAQDRKAALARENADLEAKLKAAAARAQSLQVQLDLLNDQTNVLRSRGAAWNEFVLSRPLIREQWLWYVDDVAFFGRPPWRPLIDFDWPFSAVQ